MRDSIFVDREPWRGGFSVGGDSLSQGVRSEMHITPRRRIVQWRDTAAFESLLRATLRGGVPGSLSRRRVGLEHECLSWSDVSVTPLAIDLTHVSSN